MKKIADIAQLSGLLNPYFKKGILTNNYTMIYDYQEYIDNEKLFFIKSEEEMVILRDCENHWRAYYYLKDLTSEFKLPNDKPIVMEIVFKPKDDSCKKLVYYWESNGFKSYMFRERMTSDVSQFNIDYKDKVRAGFAKNSQESSIHDLISKSFDEYLGCIPTLLEVKNLISKNEIICIENEFGGVAGLLHIGQSRNVNSIWHLAVDPKARKSGNAKKMLAFFKETLAKEKKTKVDTETQNNLLPSPDEIGEISLSYVE